MRTGVGKGEGLRAVDWDGGTRWWVGLMCWLGDCGKRKGG